MSFEIFVSAFDNEGTARIPVTWLKERLASSIQGMDGSIWRLSFGDDPGISELYLDNETATEGFAVDRPPDDLEFWKFIADVLRKFPCVLYWPTTTEIAVMGSLDLLRHLPKSLIEKMGIPRVSTDPERIRQYVWENS